MWTLYGHPSRFRDGIQCRSSLKPALPGAAGWFLIASGLFFIAPAFARDAAGKVSGLRIHFQSEAESRADDSLMLRGRDAKLQLLVTAELDNGWLRDFTREAAYCVAPANVVKIDKSGMVLPLSDGTATITAAGAGGLSATLPVTVEQFNLVKPVNFPNQIVPIFTKAGCNAGGCHGKASGQNGFKLSLLGFEPTEDYERLVKEAPKLKQGAEIPLSGGVTFGRTVTTYVFRNPRGGGPLY